MIKVVITDDHRLVREAWALLLQRDKRLSIIGICESGQQVIDACRKAPPDVVLMDINMEPINGVEATREIRKFSSDIKIIGISVHTDISYVNALMQAGGNGYVTKNSSGEEMIQAILCVVEGQQYICKEVSNTISEQ